MYFLLRIKYLNEETERGKYYQLVKVTDLKKTLVEDLKKMNYKYSNKEKIFYKELKIDDWDDTRYVKRYLVVNQKEFNELKYDVSNYFGK